jgi:hypothetical protein
MTGVGDRRVLAWIGSMNTLFAACLCLAVVAPQDRPCVLIVVGASGSPDYAGKFSQWAELWQATASKAGADSVLIGRSQEAGTTDRDRLRAILLQKASAGPEPLWIVMIGHGTFDGKEAEFAQWLSPSKRPIVVLDCTSASGPFINRLSGQDRIVVTATKSGYELNFARFGQYLAEAMGDERADLDKDGQVSLLEAFLMASSQVNEYYRNHSQLATEHALLDDNGDGLGTPAEWFRGTRATRRAKDGASLDGRRAHQIHLKKSDRERQMPPALRRRRDQIELSIAALRDQKDKLSEDVYYRRLEDLMVELARLYRDAAAKAPSGPPEAQP